MTTLNLHSHYLGLLNDKRFFMSQMLNFNFKKQITLRLFLFLYLVGGLSGIIRAQTPSIQWQKALGGFSDDVPQCIYQTRDGGYILAGVVGSRDGDVVGNHGNGDMWVVKTSANGTIEWQKSLGGAGRETGTLIQQTLDGSYIVGGNTASSNGDVSGYHGGGDMWVVKLSDKGLIQWQQSLGGRGLDEMFALQEVIINNVSNGFIVGGNTMSNNGDVSGYHGGKDVWVVKLSPTGVKQWQRALGSSGDETLNELNLTQDGGIIIGSRTSTNGGDVSGVHGSVDVWIVKLDRAGSMQWQRTLGGSGLENLVAVKTTADGYIVGTDTDSNDGDVSGLSTQRAIWIVKLNTTGNLTWQKKYDDNGSSSFRDVRQTKDGGFLVGGNIILRDNPLANQNVFLSKLTAAGSEAWRKNYGGSQQEELYLMQQTNDNGYILAVSTLSSEVNYSHSTLNNLNTDHWMLKLDENGNKKWDRAFGGSGADWYWAGCCGATTLGGVILYPSLLPNMKLQSSDGGYFFAVSSNSRDGDVTGLHYSARLGVRSDMWMVKLGPEGPSPLQSMAAPVKDVDLETSHGTKAFPNPFTKQTTIQFTAKETGRATVELYNIDGARIRSVFNKTVIGGQTYSVPVSDIELAKGIYFYFINTNKSRLSGRLVKN